MSEWIFEPGHTEAQFKARHMMVTWVRGLFKDVHGSINFDWDSCLESTFEGTIDATKIWTGEPDRDDHLRSPTSSTPRRTRRSSSRAASRSGPATSPSRRRPS